MSKSRDTFVRGEKPDPRHIETPRRVPKRCPNKWCEAYMDVKATECPYCNHPM